MCHEGYSRDLSTNNPQTDRTSIEEQEKLILSGQGSPKAGQNLDRGRTAKIVACEGSGATYVSIERWMKTATTKEFEL